ncbi:Hypothetical protein SMAX5B_019314 [Scophthalmus maximus]|uniref:Uncharacterized protein n=1 Tax=Scophthalmus maximus TaxID=52904 RepID=A0A2U9BWY7_SCOMX|nr:Hypothetical protein SMAX5B_019314 [Scophthalmus maximus]
MLSAALCLWRHDRLIRRSHVSVRKTRTQGSDKHDHTPDTEESTEGCDVTGSELVHKAASSRRGDVKRLFSPSLDDVVEPKRTENSQDPKCLQIWVLNHLEDAGTRIKLRHRTRFIPTGRLDP